MNREISRVADVHLTDEIARWNKSLLTPSTATGEGIAVKQIRISKHHRPDTWALEPLPADPRDPDIVRAKQLARRSRPAGAATRARGAEPDRGECRA